ncbi:hypothetical protein C0993_002323, partial [Termitomyces sp. T159_Od127]
MPVPAVVTPAVPTNAAQPMLAPGAIPETHLPEGWNAPLLRMMPPPPPPPALRRANRLRQVNQSAAPAPVASTSTRPLAGGPLHDISSGHADPALNNLTRGDIAHRERMANLEARQQQALAALQEQQRIRQNAMAAEQARQREEMERLRQQE